MESFEDNSWHSWEIILQGQSCRSLERAGDFGFGGNNINVTVNAGFGADGTQIGNKIVELLKQYEEQWVNPNHGDIMTATIVTTVEVLFDGSTATDISSRVENVQINYGRQRILDEYGQGTVSSPSTIETTISR